MKKILLYIALGLGLLQAQDVYAIFNVVPTQDANLTLDSSGTIAEINVDVGSEVSEGMQLLQLANKDKVVNVEMQQAQSQAIQQQYIFAQKQYQRYKQTKNAVDQNTLDRYYFDFKNLESSYLQSQHNVKYQQELLNKTILKAPFDGIIASKEVELGDGVAANNTILFRLISKETKIILEFDVKYAGGVKEGDEFEFTLGDDKKRVVKLSKVYPTADDKTRKVKAEAIVEGLIPGTFGDGYIRTK